MSVNLLVILGVVAVFVFLFWVAARSSRREREKQEAYFTSMFPDLQPLYHPGKVLEFVRARLAQAPARGGMRMKSPPGFDAHHADVSFFTDKKGREREQWVLLDEAGRELSRFFFESDAKDGMVRVGEGKFRVAKNQDRVRYWHPDREFKWTAPGLWKFTTRVFDREVDADRGGVSFSDSSSSSSSSSRSATTAAAAAGIAAAGGTFDGGGASAGWDAKGSSDSADSDSTGSEAAATTSY
jgi:hypothetical protein